MSMLKDETQRSVSRGERSFLATCGALLSALICSIVVIVAPRPVQPGRLPALRVPLSEAKRAFGEIASSGRALPASLERWYELYREAGLNEREPELDPDIVAAQRSELWHLVEREFPKLGSAGIAALMDTLSERALASLRSERPTAEGYGLLGAFPSLLARYGYLDDRGRAIAPPRVLRVLYLQRFNLICARALDADIDAFDRKLFEGWVALHGAKLPPERRALAARNYAALGGLDAREALAIWSFYGGLTEQAAQLLRREYERTGALRLRNLSLFVQRGSQPSG
jgi:hypothetical protein